MVKPITPQEVTYKTPVIPDFVIEAVNRLIREKWDGDKAVIYENAILRRICVKENNCTEEQVFENKWLSLEGIYRKAGWKVERKKTYGDVYEEFFVFMKK